MSTPASPVHSRWRVPTETHHVAAVCSEALFVILPIIVLTIVLLTRGRTAGELFASPEWAFAAAVFMGQALVKIVYAITATREPHVVPERLGLMASAIIVLGLVPSLIVLSLLLADSAPGRALVVMQLFLFVAGLAVFLRFGAIAHNLLAGRWSDA